MVDEKELQKILQKLPKGWRRCDIPTIKQFLCVPESGKASDGDETISTEEAFEEFSERVEDDSTGGMVLIIGDDRTKVSQELKRYREKVLSYKNDSNLLIFDNNLELGMLKPTTVEDMRRKLITNFGTFLKENYDAISSYYSPIVEKSGLFSRKKTIKNYELQHLEKIADSEGSESLSNLLSAIERISETIKKPIFIFTNAYGLSELEYYTYQEIVTFSHSIFNHAGNVAQIVAMSRDDAYASQQANPDTFTPRRCYLITSI